MNTIVRTLFVTALVTLTVLAEQGRAQTPLDLLGLSRGRARQARTLQTVPRPPRVMRTARGWAPYQAEDLSESFKSAFLPQALFRRSGSPATTTEAGFFAADEVFDDVVDGDVIDEVEVVDQVGDTFEWYESGGWQGGAFLERWSRPRGPPAFGGLWFRGAYLHWWTDGLDVPALITQSPDGTNGVLGQSNTTILVGDDDLIRTRRAGALYTLGIPLPNCGWSLEGSYLFLDNNSHGATFTSSGNPTLARPLFDVSTGNDSSSLIAFTGLRNGTVGVSASSEFEAAEVVFRRSILGGCDGGLQIDFIAGYRYAGLTDRLSVTQSTNDNDTGGAAPGSSSVLADHFTTDNNFHGGQIGTVSTYRRDRWSLEVLAKLAFGNTHSTATVSGTNLKTDAIGEIKTDTFGLLARKTNIGRFESDQFAVMPELGVTLGYEITRNLEATFGYRFLYMSRVARAGDQIDLDLNLNLSDPLVGAARPVFAFEHTDFWAQGLVFGFDYRF